MKTILSIIIIFLPTLVFALDEHFKAQKNKLDNSPGVWEVWDIVDNSKYCYRKRFIMIYKNDVLITGTPLLDRYENNNSDQLKDAIKIIREECF